MSQGRCLLFLLMILATACGELGELPNPGTRGNALNSDFFYTYKAYVYSKNPIVNGDTSYNPDMYDHLDTVALITGGTDFLEEKCTLKFDSGASYDSAYSCIRVKNDKSPTTSLLQAQDGSWNFNPESDEFYQVNTYYHTNLILDRFLDSLAYTYNYVHYQGPLTVPPATNFYLPTAKSFWFNFDQDDTEQNILKVYSKCYLDPMNSFYDPSTNQLCMGYNDTMPSFAMVQDPSVIYHEMGHVITKVMLNQRNIWFNGISYSRQDYLSDFGSLFYDEAGAIGEGIADFFAYYITGRSKIGEWSMGRFFDAARPLNEDDSLHLSQVGAEGSLSYPQFLHYDPNYPDEIIEDVHNAGMTASHYLVALTNEFKNNCSSLKSYSGWDMHKEASNYTMLLLIESMAELGDLFGKGSDLVTPTNAQSFANVNATAAYDWAHIVHPPTYRKFFRIMSKNIKAYMTDGLCPEFTLDKSEKLLDDYGLLLFKYYGIAGSGTDGIEDADGMDDMTYSDLNGNSIVFGRTFTSSSEVWVNETNRKKTALVSKQFLDLPSDKSLAYVFDKKSTVDSLLSELTYQGKDVFYTSDLASTAYNNNNIKISPGEVVAISLNLFNSSNTAMAGIHISAADWDHMYVADQSNNGLEPCQYDGFPLTSEGGIESVDWKVPGDCKYSSRSAAPYQMSAGLFPKDPVAPVCTVQLLDENETRWVSQGYFRNAALSLEDEQCLNNSPADGSDMNPHECLIRFLPGANHAYYSKINPQKAWAETLQGESAQSVSLNSSGVMVMEVNKWIQPGTTFNCRFRANYSNCSDCFDDTTNGREYPDYEFSGHRPYKLINFQFTVID